ncbi:MAG: hypothetical protein LBU12_07200 [Deltaproteobacteria bacterium]|nr:hypothetical protein [Deltaproteobacteria bacterium]
MAELGIAARPKLTPEGSSDVGAVSWRCPALQPLLDISGGRPASVHTAEFAEFAELAGRPATADFFLGRAGLSRFRLEDQTGLGARKA